MDDGTGWEVTIRDNDEPSNTSLATVFAWCGETIVSTDADGVITFWNPAAERLFGLAAAAMANQPFRLVVPTEGAQDWASFLAQVAAADAPQTREAQCRRPDGSLADVELVAAAIRDADGSVTGYVFVVRDISHQKQAGEAVSELVDQLKAANDALERLNVMKTDVVATISHEFRTPLTSIQGFSELLETTQLTQDEIRSFARTINQSALRLGRMISDQLDLETLAAGHWPLHRTSINLNGLVARVLSALQSIAANHDFVTNLAPDLPRVDGDADLLERVITNIVANAIKYSPAGGVITLTTIRRHDDIELSVADLGLGVPEEDRQQIFAPYGRVGRPEHMKIGGTGLGLPIARQILEVHHGRIWVEPNVPHGSIFRILLPTGDSKAEGS